jgi:hypothetical protein
MSEENKDEVLEAKIKELEETIGYVVQKFYVCKQEEKWDSRSTKELRHYLGEVTNKLHAVSSHGREDE